MMTIEDYALDVGKTTDEIKALCDKIGIKYEDENSTLSETDIILLDNELQDAEDYITGDLDIDSDKELEDDIDDKAEMLAMNTKFDLDNETTFEKVNGIKIPYRIAPRRDGDLPMYYANSKKAEKELGFKTTKGLEEICRDSWKYVCNTMKK